MSGLRRRDLLLTTAFLLASGGRGRAAVIAGLMPWWPDAGSPPRPVLPGPWRFFTAAEAALVEALADRIIPPDPQTPGGKDAGCAVFLDRQLAGPYGRREGLYTQPPFQKGTEQQGPQSPQGPADLYRSALAALDAYCRGGSDRKAFVELTPARQDAILEALEKGSIDLRGVDTKLFFDTLIKDVQQGFFADPIYGGNRDMCAWKMIGFPGARYDYRDWVGRHNEPYPYPPVSLMGRAEWMPRKS